MALTKSPLNINFAQGLDLKTDPYQVQPGKFLQLQNSIFTKGGLLQKRNGYGELPTLPDDSSNYLTTFNGNLLAIGNNLQAYSQSSENWVNKSQFTSSKLTVLPVIRNSFNQVQAESIVASNGLVCTVYTQISPITTYTYVITNSTTGQNIVAPTSIVPLLGTIVGTPRLFLLGNHFTIVFTNFIAPSYHLRYFTISTTNPTQVTTDVNLSNSYVPSTTISFDGYVVDSSLYLAWNGADAGGAIRVTRIDSNLNHHNTVVFNGFSATQMSVTADSTGPNLVVYTSFYDSGSSNGFTLAVDSGLLTVLAPTQTIIGENVANITSTAQNGSCEIIYEINNNYGYDTAIATNYLEKVSITVSGTVSANSVLVRSVGLASKAFLLNGITYFLSIYNSDFQPSYFLLNDNGKILSQLAYSNGGSYYTLGLPSVTITNNIAQMAYLIKDLIQSVNKTQGLANPAGIYTQTGINLATFTIGSPINTSSEIGSNLNVPTGFLLAYDGYQATENGFFLYPDYVEVNTSPIGGALIPQDYFYVATYEWTDNQGNIFRSAPSIPVEAKVALPDVNSVTFQSIFPGTTTSITVDNPNGLSVGQVVTDVTTPGNLTGNTFITAISGNVVTLSQPTVTASAVAPGDTLSSSSSPILCTSVFAMGDLIITVSDGTNLKQGQKISDLTTPASFDPNTFISSITGNTVVLSRPTLAASASTPGDILSSSYQSLALRAVFPTGTKTLTVDSTYGLVIGQVVSDTTTPANIVAGSYITALTPTAVTISEETTGASAAYPGDTITIGGTFVNIIDIPTLRLTYKTENPARIVIYRWSVGQQNYFQLTSIASPIVNDTTIDYVTFTDDQPDSAILGNTLLYTTGGVLEDIAAPPSDTVALFGSRLFLVDSEDKNILWFSKQVIEATPVEMSDLLTIYVAPTTAAQGSTGGITALSAMDDKLIIFKKDAIYYLTGVGPDNTGSNSQYSDPIFITSTVGCTNQKSIVFMPNGLMFQSDKGIWILGRDLSSNYIGAAVETYTQTALVQSAVNVPGTNQVRFTLDSGMTLMYDYYFGQWGTFVNVPAISSTLYQSLHTYIDKFGQVFQETLGQYLDGSKPVLMNFTTSWLNLAGLQGYQRAYYFYLLGTYVSPHKLTIGIAYDYNSSPTQTSVIDPINFNPAWGGLAQWGSSPSWGGNPSLEQWRVFLQQQKCQAFQITVNESFDTTYDVPAGAGLTISGLDVILGMKSGYPRLKPTLSVG